MRALLSLNALLCFWPWCCCGLVSRGDPTAPERRKDSIADVWIDEAQPKGNDTCGHFGGSACWMRPAKCTECKVPPRVAIAYRGHYFRKILSKRGQLCGHNQTHICSDAFHNVDSHWKHLVKPLQAAGASVKTFFHTYRSGGDESSKQRDDRLVQLLSPARYGFDDYSPGSQRLSMDADDEDEDEHEGGHVSRIRQGAEDSVVEGRSRIVDSMMKVLDMILQDKESFDAVVLTRFDLRFRARITQLNVWWNVTNAAHRDGPETWKRERKLSDLFFVIPIGHVETFRESLRVSGTYARNHPATGAGHWVYTPFIQRMGNDISMMRTIDSHCQPSTAPPCEAQSFLAISRTCGAEFD